MIDTNHYQAELERLLAEARTLRNELALNRLQCRDIRRYIPAKKKVTPKAKFLDEIRSKYVLIGRKEFINGLMPVFENKTFSQSAKDLGVSPSTIAEAYHKLRRRWVRVIRLRAEAGAEKTPEIQAYLQWKKQGEQQ
ncbi:MAG TPA: hypothetical protein VNS88_16670 [Nitrospiraceae bacterium]|nr:hypothetical protein [Nitrospiraceae bacterium]